jgi:hypothetical protein
MFGTFLRMERTRLNLSSRTVADRLRVSDTYLRLVEAGRAALNQSLAFEIIEVFADSDTQTHEFGTISFNRLALFMVGMHWVGAQMAAHDEGGRHAVEDLGTRVSDFQVFLERTKGYFEPDEGTPEQKRFLEDIASPAVGVFLRSESYGRDDIGSLEENVLPSSELLNLPTLNIDVLLALKEELKGRSFVHTADIASRWESQHSSQFLAVRGLYVREDLIMKQDNLDLFYYKYLSEKRFADIQMIFMTDRKERDLREAFVKGVNRGREKQPGLQPLTQVEINKIHLRGLSQQQVWKHQKMLDRIRSGRSTTGASPKPYDAYWSFETHSGLQIGFVGVLDENADNTRNLNLRDSVVKAREFKELWRRVNADR